MVNEVPAANAAAGREFVMPSASFVATARKLPLFAVATGLISFCVPLLGAVVAFNFKRLANNTYSNSKVTDEQMFRNECLKTKAKVFWGFVLGTLLCLSQNSFRHENLEGVEGRRGGYGLFWNAALVTAARSHLNNPAPVDVLHTEN